MTDSNNKKVTATVKPLDEKEVKGRLEDVNDWNLSADGSEIFRKVEIDSFNEVAIFIERVVNFFRKNNHSPYKITIKNDEVEFRLKTAEVEGLTKKDFKLAKEIDFIVDWDADFQKWLSSTKVIIVLLVLFGLVLFWRYFL